jgi:hypothetical protein
VSAPAARLAHDRRRLGTPAKRKKSVHALSIELTTRRKLQEQQAAFVTEARALVEKLLKFAARPKPNART